MTESAAGSVDHAGDLKTAILQRALDEGFSQARVTRPDAVPHVVAQLQAFLAKGYHGEMGWLADRVAWRGDPSALWPEARSVVMLAENYARDFDPRERFDWREDGVISVYAQHKDYHDVAKKRLKRLGRWLVSETGCEIKVFVDTAPVPEKALAQAAGLGWQGKHTNLVSRELGSWFFLGALFTTLDLTPDAGGKDHCGACRACLDICPTDAFPAPYQLDARRCISYLTIEHKGPVDLALRPKLGTRIYGCDDCLAVCPWNKFAQRAQETKYHARDDLSRPDLATLAALDDAAFRQVFSGSPIKRIGRNRFVRNVLYAIGNSNSERLLPVAQALCNDPEPVVADAARWAVAQLQDGVA